MTPAPAIRTFSKPLCILCGSAGRVLYGDLEDHRFSAPGVWQLKHCTRPVCGLAWLDPAPVPEDLGLAYQDYHTHTGLEAGPAPIALRAGKWAYSAGVTIAAVVIGLYQEQRKFRHMLISDLCAGRLLDVGCGDGRFVHLMAKQGWLGTGIDFDAIAIESGRKKYGLNLVEGDFQTAQLAAGEFDAVTMAHVIEHVPDPVACLKKCRELLKPGGRLVVTTPNLGSIGHQRFGRHWRGLEPPRHLHIFSADTLAECALRAGFVVVGTGTTAVNADYLAKESLAIRKATAVENSVFPRAGVRDALAAAAFQYREHFALRRRPKVGEEAFLVAERGDAAECPKS